MTASVNQLGYIGHDVHYVIATGEHRAAKILDVNSDGSFYLAVFSPGKMTYVKSARQDDNHAAGTWHAIERI